jgi:hypothetical protein
MQEPIDLIETAPGEWRFVRLLKLAMGRHLKDEAEARRERFFDSLDGEAIKPQPDAWWTGLVGVGLISTTFLLVLLGSLGNQVPGDLQQKTAAVLRGVLAMPVLFAACAICLAPWAIVITQSLIKVCRRP